MEELTKAEENLYRLKGQISKQQNIVDELREKHILPENIKKYKGKYFVHANKDINGSWPVYYFVKEVGSHRCKVISFEIQPPSNYKVIDGDDIPFHMLKSEITEKEFAESVAHFKKQVLGTLGLIA